MKYIIFIIIALVVITNIIRKATAKSGSGKGIIEGFLENILAGQNESSSLDDVKIYDENGNEVTFGDDNSFLEQENRKEVVIYDEDGNVMSPDVVEMVTEYREPEVVQGKKTTPAKNVVTDGEYDEAQDAAMYRDFISSNGGSAIVVQEILGKPLALRDNT